MGLKSEKGYSLVEVGVGLILISIFMVCGITMIKGTFNTYRFVEQRNVALSYLIKAVELELLDDNSISITDDMNDTTIREETTERKVKVTTIPSTTITITTTVENLPTKDGKSYANSRVKLLTGEAEFYIRKNDESSRRVITIKTIKVEGVGSNVDI